MWFSAIKLAVSAGSKIYANKQKTKMAMSDAQLMHASRMAEGKERLDLDRMKSMMNQQNQDEKFDQNEELANLRAKTSLEKQEIANEARLSLDKSKFMQGQQLDNKKLQQNEELANLRADTAMAKSEMSAEVKLTSDLMKAADVKTLKGPQR